MINRRKNIKDGNNTNSKIKWLYSGTKWYSGSENKDRTKAGKSSQ